MTCRERLEKEGFIVTDIKTSPGRYENDGFVCHLPMRSLTKTDISKQGKMAELLEELGFYDYEIVGVGRMAVVMGDPDQDEEDEGGR